MKVNVMLMFKNICSFTLKILILKLKRSLRLDLKELFAVSTILMTLQPITYNL